MRTLRVDEDYTFDLRIYAKYVGMKNSHYRVFLLCAKGQRMHIDHFLALSEYAYLGARNPRNATVIQSLESINSKDLGRFMRTQKYLNQHGLRITVPKATWQQEKQNSFWKFGKKDLAAAS